MFVFAVLQEDLRLVASVFAELRDRIARRLQIGVKNVKPGLCETLVARNFYLTLMNKPGGGGGGE